MKHSNSRILTNIDKLKSWLFKRINKIDKSLANLRERNQVNKTRNKEILPLKFRIKKNNREYYELLCQRTRSPRYSKKKFLQDTNTKTDWRRNIKYE
jgi:hypothetical protein